MPVHAVQRAVHYVWRWLPERRGPAASRLLWGGRNESLWGYARPVRRPTWYDRTREAQAFAVSPSSEEKQHHPLHFSGPILRSWNGSDRKSLHGLSVPE